VDTPEFIFNVSATCYIFAKIAHIKIYEFLLGHSQSVHESCRNPCKPIEIEDFETIVIFSDSSFKSSMANIEGSVNFFLR